MKAKESAAALLARLSKREVFLAERDGTLVHTGAEMSGTERTEVLARADELVAYLQARQAGVRHFTPLPEAHAEPALIQEMWWAWCRPAKDQLPHEKLCLVIPMEGLDADRARSALRRLFGRHSTLRSHFAERKGVLALAPNPVDAFRPETGQLDDALPLAAACEAERARLLKTSMRIEEGLLARTFILNHRGAPAAVGLLIHHMVMDARSLLILERELRQMLAPDAPPDVLLGAAPQYLDYAAWERRWIEETAGPLVAHWRRWLAEIPPLHAPDTGTRMVWAPGLKTYYDLEIGGAATAALRNLAAHAHCSPFAPVLAAVGMATARWSGDERFALRVIGDLRTARTMVGMVGNLVCTDLVQMRAGEAKDPQALMRSLATEYAAAVRLRLPNLLGLPDAEAFPDLSEGGVGDKTGVTLNYLPIYAFRGFREASLGPLHPTVVKSPQEERWPVPMCPINLRVWDFGGSLAAKFEFNQDLIDAHAQRRYCELFAAAVLELAALAEAPEMLQTSE